VSLLVVGMSFRTAPIPMLERASVNPAEVPKVLHELLRGGHISEALVLSTCNRIEFYAEAERFHAGMGDVSAALARRAGLDLSELSDNLYVQYDDAALSHLFSVAAGLDSMVVGESHILGQLRTAYQTASRHEATGRVLHELCQAALRVGKRVRTETGIGRAGASVVSVAVHEAERLLGPAPGASTIGPLAGRHALVVGVGSIGALAATTLSRAGVADVVLANRGLDRAEKLAASLRASTKVRVVGLDALAEEVAAADLVVAATGAIGQILPYDLIETAVAGRGGRELAVVDLALPRDVDPGVAGLPGVHYVDLEAVKTASASVAADDHVPHARFIVAEEVNATVAARRAVAVAPTVAALRARAAEVVQAELTRLDGRLPDLDPGVRAEVAHAVHRVVQTLLHQPTVRVKELAEQPGGDTYATVLRELFGLDPAAAAAVTSVSNRGIQ
jgi:glutamyl-tRNA reductase